MLTAHYHRFELGLKSIFGLGRRVRLSAAGAGWGKPRQTGQKCSCVGLSQHGFTILGEF